MNVLRKLTKYEIKIHARSTPFGIFLSRLAADGSITRKGENERKRRERRDEKGRIIAKSGYLSDTLSDHSSAIDSRGKEGGGGGGGRGRI